MHAAVASMRLAKLHCAPTASGTPKQWSAVAKVSSFTPMLPGVMAMTEAMKTNGIAAAKRQSGIWRPTAAAVSAVVATTTKKRSIDSNARRRVRDGSKTP